MSSQEQELSALIATEHAGKRLDQVLALLFSDYSRSRLQEWVKQGRVTVDGKVLRPKDKVLGGEEVRLSVSLDAPLTDQPQPIPLDLLYEDQELLVINKPAGMVVHPAAGNPDGTLLNALLNHDEQAAQLPRAGIVHRLDKETSGILVVARTLKAHKSLVDQLQARGMKREYRAIVQGVMTAKPEELMAVDGIGRRIAGNIRWAVSP